MGLMGTITLSQRSSHPAKRGETHYADTGSGEQTKQCNFTLIKILFEIIEEDLTAYLTYVTWTKDCR